MEKKYYDLILSLIKEHRRYSGLEMILNDIADDVWQRAQTVILSINDETVITEYLRKVVNSSIITVSKRLNCVKPKRQTQLPEVLVNTSNSSSELELTVENLDSAQESIDDNINFVDESVVISEREQEEVVDRYQDVDKNLVDLMINGVNIAVDSKNGEEELYEDIDIIGVEDEEGSLKDFSANVIGEVELESEEAPSSLNNTDYVLGEDIEEDIEDLDSNSSDGFDLLEETTSEVALGEVVEDEIQEVELESEEAPSSLNNTDYVLGEDIEEDIADLDSNSSDGFDLLEETASEVALGEVVEDEIEEVELESEEVPSSLNNIDYVLGEDIEEDIEDLDLNSSDGFDLLEETASEIALGEVVEDEIEEVELESEEAPSSLNSADYVLGEDIEEDIEALDSISSDGFDLLEETTSEIALGEDLEEVEEESEEESTMDLISFDNAEISLGGDIEENVEVLDSNSSDGFDLLEETTSETALGEDAEEIELESEDESTMDLIPFDNAEVSIGGDIEENVGALDSISSDGFDLLEETTSETVLGEDVEEIELESEDESTMDLISFDNAEVSIGGDIEENLEEESFNDFSDVDSVEVDFATEEETTISSIECQGEDLIHSKQDEFEESFSTQAHEVLDIVEDTEQDLSDNSVIKNDHQVSNFEQTYNTDEIFNKIHQLEQENPDMQILTICDLKYNQKCSILDISNKLGRTKGEILDVLNIIIDTIKD